MRSTTTPQFHKLFARLPEQVQQQAREAYRLFKQNPSHPGLRFKQVHPSQPIYSLRISLDYRAVGEKEGDEITWFWIGSHSDYDKLLNKF
jgi:hypothetical protein